jgi:hypothetical protein
LMGTMVGPGAAGIVGLMLSGPDHYLFQSSPADSSQAFSGTSSWTGR